METIISIEAAEKEWRDFLEENDAKGLIPNDDDDKAAFADKKTGFERVIRAISRGLIVIEDGIITQNLKYPIKGKDDGKVIIDKLVYDQRWTSKDREDALKGMDVKDQSQALIIQRRFCSKLTGVDMIILQKIDGYDYRITDQIVSVFFM
jgi:hypothetical protein